MAKKSAIKPSNMTADSSASNIQGDGQLRGQMRIDPKLEKASIEEVLTQAGLNFKPLLASNRFEVGSFSGESKFNQSIIRDDNGAEIGGVGMGYMPVSHLEAFKSLFTEAVSEIGGLPARALSFDGGGIGVVQFKMPGDYKAGGQGIQMWLSLINALNGKFPIRAGTSGVTVVCGNTCALASKDLSYGAKHTKNVNLKLRSIREILTDVNTSFGQYVNQLEAWSIRKISSEEVNQFISLVFPEGTKTKEGAIRANVTNKRGLLSKAIQTEAEVYGKDSALSLWQGVTRMVDHSLAPIKASKTQEENEGVVTITATPKMRSEADQYEYATLGSGQVLKNEAMAIMRDLFGKVE